MTSTETLSAWMQAIIDEDCEKAEPYIQITWLADHGLLELGELTKLKITDFKIIKREQFNKVMERFTIEIEHIKGTSVLYLMAIKEKAVRRPSESGTWGINPNSWRVAE